ncbi:MAG: hypothetical protein PHI53_02830 [Candidatus Pacebacteria bacterium]|nr:hypothetical protein [Candidatus Paceibacterota bacterium]
MSLKKKRIIIILAILTALALIIYLLTRNPLEKRYKELERDYNKINDEIQILSQDMADKISSKDWDGVKDKGREIITKIETLLKIEDDLIALSQSLDKDKDSVKLKKRKEAEEKMLDFENKLIECMDFKIETSEEEFNLCNEETAEIYQDFERLIKEYQSI